MTAKKSQMPTRLQPRPAGAPAHPTLPASSREVLTTDQYAGLGGSYLFDPATGTRTPITDEDPQNG